MKEGRFMTYLTSTENRPLNIINVHDLEEKVESRMDAGAFHSVRGGAGEEFTLKENIESFNRKKIVPRSLKGLASVDTKTSIFGVDLSMPVIACPVAAHGIMHEEAETASFRGTAAAGSLFTSSTYSNHTLDEIVAGNPDGNFFFQLYMNKNEEFNKFMVDKAVRLGAKALVLTVDAIVGGNRESDNFYKWEFPVAMGNLAEFFNSQSAGGVGRGIAEIFGLAKQDLGLEHIQMLKEMSGLPVIIKGVQSPEDADEIIRAGADGIWVSNHGGRQLDGAPASFEMLPLIAKVVDKRVPIIFDSGIRRGQHIFKAIASGADVVAIGRPVMYGLNLGGAKGVTSVFEHLEKELSIAMMLGGTKDIEEIKTKSQLV